MQTLPITVQSLSVDAAIGSQPIHTYLGWEICLSRVVRERTDKGWWLHWHHPADREQMAQAHRVAVRYGHFVAPDQTLEGALHTVCQLIDASVALESMANERSRAPQGERSELWQALSIAS